MKPATISILKKELRELPQEELVDLCLHLGRFKKENKELLSYLLFDSLDEDEYIRKIKEEIDEGFSTMNQSNLYYAKKSIRKILRAVKKYIRYSKNKETEAELLLYFCSTLGQVRLMERSQQLLNMYDGQLRMAKKAIDKLHEDLQYDYQRKLEELEV